MRLIQPVANGLHTNHPIPYLPFVDDSHIPVHDGDAIERVGRHAETGMWGRVDRAGTRDGSEWAAFTTDPINHRFSWAVRHHPQHGTTVVLVHDNDAASMHSDWTDSTLLWRSGGYWWDGTHWYRPLQVWDQAHQQYAHRKVKAPTTVTAHDLLDDNADPGRGRILKVANLDPDQPPTTNHWLDDLALWAKHQTEQGTDLRTCVVKLSAPELAGDQLIGATELADIAGVAPSSLRSYISRGTGDVPAPQANVSGRSAWSRPVAQDWAEARHRSNESIAASLASNDDANLSIGAADVRDRYAKTFFSQLWDWPERRKRWALRHRNPQSVEQVAGELAWSVAADLDGIIPTHALAATIRHAFLDEITTGLDTDEETGQKKPPSFFGFLTPLTVMLDWFIRHHPDRAATLVAEIIGEAERQMNVPPQVTARSLRTALALDGKLNEDARKDFFARVMLPATGDDD